MQLVQSGRFWMVFLALTGVGTLAMSLAFAEPPPPNFQQFTISNSTGNDITDLELKLYKAVGPKYETMDPTPISLTLSELPHNSSVELSFKKSWGIMKITANAKCGGKPLQEPLEIQAPFMDCDGDQDKEYPGFCYEAPTGEANYKPVLEFRLNGGIPVGELRAKYRWGNLWAGSPVTKMKPFQ